MSDERRQPHHRDPLVPTWRAVRGRQVLASLMLAAALLVGSVTSYHAIRDTRTTIHAVALIPRVNGRIALQHNSADAFVDFVRNLVPEHAPIRVLGPPSPRPAGAKPFLGPAGRCGNTTNTMTYWLLVYQLQPRPSVCDSSRAWTIYFRSPVPAGANVHRFAVDLGVSSP